MSHIYIHGMHQYRLILFNAQALNMQHACKVVSMADEMHKACNTYFYQREEMLM